MCFEEVELIVRIVFGFRWVIYLFVYLFIYFCIFFFCGGIFDLGVVEEFGNLGFEVF